MFSSFTVVPVFAASVVLVWLLCFPVCRELVRRQMLDRPNARSSHEIPTPRGGGIAIMLVVIGGIVAVGFFNAFQLLNVLAGAAGFLAAVSLLDDFKPVPARIRFAAQSIAALAFLFAFARFYGIPAAAPLRITGWTVFAFWIVGYTNSFNFMDGINGISGIQASVTGLGSILIVGFSRNLWSHPLELCAGIVAGAALGFLPHNFPRARMFMGDVGSAPLGFLLASLPLAFSAEFGWELLPPLVLLHLNYILDTTITLIRRHLHGEKVYEAHKEHFYQRLVRAGQSHAVVTSWELALQLITVSLLSMYPFAPFVPRLVIIAAVFFIWLAFFFGAEWLFRRSPEGHVRSKKSLPKI
jgi:UDP-N-acetylmuramyl pentapeptide phosphotransferase/UDP-N-acetylglucosamine-1-phosphate transferase